MEISHLILTVIGCAGCLWMIVHSDSLNERLAWCIAFILQLGYWM